MQRIVLAFIALLATIVPAPVLAQRTVAIRESVDIGNPEGAEFFAPFAINNHGTIVGTAATADLRDRAFVWTQRRGYELIAEDAIAWDVNDRGLVVGAKHGAVTTGFTWTRGRGLTDLGAFLPYAVNNAGVMAGVCLTDQRPCVWRDGVVTALTSVEGWLWAINARGDVVGTTITETAFLWTREGAVVDLGPGVAEDINNRGTIAGSRVEGPLRIATVWTRRGVVTPAPDGGAAQRVNEREWVLVHTGGRPHVMNLATGARVELRSSQGVSFSFDMNDRGDVVGIVEIAGVTRVVVWRVRGKHMHHGRR
jgi:probable HAF family extracellular repeat protein